jgi:hypothetical protein
LQNTANDLKNMLTQEKKNKCHETCINTASREQEHKCLKGNQSITTVRHHLVSQCKF